MRKVSDNRMRPVQLLFVPALVIGLLLLLVPGCVLGQEVTAAITGTVTDPSGATIAGAKIAAVDSERGVSWPTTTNEAGVYNLPRVPVGTYTVRVEMDGFQPMQQSNVTLSLNQTARIDFRMQIGNATTSVEVTSEVPMLQTDAVQLGSVIDARTNTQLPLATRNYIQLTLLTAGAVTVDPGGFKTAQTSFNSSRPYINGNREQTNNFILDGVDNNQVSDNLVAYTPSVDAIQEFNQITQNASAEFGNFMGGITSVSIKSGTNQYHGGLFEFFRNDVLNANEWSNNLTGAPKSKLRWNEFGGNLGGPIRSNKLFFFADYQGSRFSQPGTTSAITVLPNAARQGDFSMYSTTLYDPLNVDANGNRVPYAGNKIPVTQLNQTALNIVNSKYYPAALSDAIRNNQYNTSQSHTYGDQGDLKIDYNITDKDHLVGRYSQAMTDNPSINSQALMYNSFGNYPIHNGMLDYTRTITPSIVNDARVGVNYTVANNGISATNLPDLAKEFGIPGVPIDILPSMTMQGGLLSSIGNPDGIQLFNDTVIQLEDTVIMTKGKHTMHFGFQAFRQRVNTFYSGNNGTAGTFYFNGQYTTSNPDVKFGGGQGQPEADFMLGLPSSIGVGTNGGTWGQRSTIFSGFAQDSWRATPNLTINYGIRYELRTPWVEVYDRQVNFGEFTGEQMFAGKNGNNRALYNQYNGITNWEPRVGLAWTPRGGRTVIRAAYSLSSFLEGTGTNLRLPLNPPFSAERTANYSSLGYPTTTLDQGYTPIGSTSDPYAGANLKIWDPNVRPAVSNQWNLSVQRQLDKSTTLQVGYVGQRNTHLMVAMPFLQGQLMADGTVAPSPYLAGNPALKNEISHIAATDSTGNQSYNALQATIQRRFADGLQYQLSYTYSKCMTDSIGYFGVWSGQAANASAYWQNMYDRKAEWGPCYYDVAQNVSSFVSYDLPFGHNRKFGKTINKYVNGIIGDWQVNAMLSFHGGFPLTINGSDNSGTHSDGPRANCLSPAHVNGRQNYSGGGYLWFDPTAYGPASAGTFGTCGVGTVRGPGIKSADVSFSKAFQVKEGQRVEFRSEFINFTNTPILNAPGAWLGSNLGVIQSSQGARNIQFALKYSF